VAYAKVPANDALIILARHKMLMRRSLVLGEFVPGTRGAEQTQGLGFSQFSFR
jgi:hypothetical protein